MIPARRKILCTNKIQLLAYYSTYLSNSIKTWLFWLNNLGRWEIHDFMLLIYKKYYEHLLY